MSRVVRVEVTAEDIAAGERGVCARCPIARALQRVTNCNARVGYAPAKDDVAVWWHESGVASDELPEAAFRFVSDFDHGLPVVPFSFDLTLPDDSPPSPPEAQR